MNRRRLLLAGGAVIIAAGEPKELWLEPELGHTDFDHARAREYESRVVAFFDRYLARQSGARRSGFR